jgi:hypothetical protein
VLALLLMLAHPGLAVELTLHPDRDATLYGRYPGSQANGWGQHFFAGTNYESDPNRALLHFDLAGVLPPGAQIFAAYLRCHMSRTSAFAGSRWTTLHRVLSDWGEGPSDPPGEEGAGQIPPSPGDATWLHTFYPDQLWLAAGGDFEAAPSGGCWVQDVGDYLWSDPQIVADVQTWLNEPALNHGWLMKGEEDAAPTAKRFDSKDHPYAENWPILVIEYGPPSGCWLNCPGQDGGWISDAGDGGKSPDINGSGLVDVVDFAYFGAAYGESDACSDFDCNGHVDISDFAIFATHMDHGPGPAGDCY